MQDLTGEIEGAGSAFDFDLTTSPIRRGPPDGANLDDLEDSASLRLANQEMQAKSTIWNLKITD